MTLGHCGGLGDVNTTHSSSDAPLSLPRPPTIYLELREEDLKEQCRMRSPNSTCTLYQLLQLLKVLGKILESVGDHVHCS